MYRIAIFASGEGNNAQQFINYYKDRNDIGITLIVTNNKDAGVVQKANDAGIPVMIVDKITLYESDKVVDELIKKADFIVLAGFLWLIPENILKVFAGKMVNIHPALLPKYGGKGMYGMRVHEAVIIKQEKESGITIHYVNNKYDDGKIIFQAKCPVDLLDTPRKLARKVHELEYKYYPVIVDKLLLENIS